MFAESIILSGQSYYRYDQLFKIWIERIFTARLCWRATRDGWSASTFHSNCNYKKPTVTLVKVGSYIFGGYATESWEGETTIINVTSFHHFLPTRALAFGIYRNQWRFHLEIQFFEKGGGGRMYMKSNRYTEFHFIKTSFGVKIGFGIINWPLHARSSILRL
jgi:hypothetical protein